MALGIAYQVTLRKHAAIASRLAGKRIDDGGKPHIRHYKQPKPND